MNALIQMIERKLGRWCLVCVGASVFIMMVIEVLNVLGRKFYKPFPCTVETAESLMIVCVFVGLAYVSWREEHTIVGLMTDRLRPSIKRFMDGLSNLFGAVVFAIVAFGAWSRAWESLLMLEVRIGVYDFPVWVFRIVFALGLSHFVFQMAVNTVRFMWQALDPEWNWQGRRRSD